MPDITWTFSIVFFGYVILGITGFGSALIIVPLLSWKLPLSEVVILTLLLDLPSCLFHSYLNRTQILWAEIKSMLPGMLVGSASGLWLIQNLEPRLPLMMLGLYVFSMGCMQLRNQVIENRVLPAYASPIAGFSAGLVEMMFGAAGPVMMTWLRLRVSDLSQVRATAPALITCSALIVLVQMVFAEKLNNKTIGPEFIWLMSGAFLGVFTGNKIAKNLARNLISKSIAMILIISGLSLIRDFFIKMQFH